MSNAARKQLGIQPEIIKNSDKHAVLPTHDLHVGPHVIFQDSTSKHWYPAVIKICVLNQEVTRYWQEMVLFTRKPNLIWSLLYLRTGTLYLPSVCHHWWHNLPIWGQWKLSSRRSHKWTIQYKYRQTDLKGILSPLSSLIFKYFKCLLCEY